MLESRRRALIFLLLAIVLAAISGFLVLKKVQALNTELGTMVMVYTADKSIPSRTIITPNDVTTTELPVKYVSDEHVTDVQKLANKVSVVPLSAGDLITNKILKEASAVTKEDNRLVSVLKSEKVIFGEKLYALDRVDIIVSHKLEDAPPVTEVFMEDIKVARVAENEGEFTGVQIEIPHKQVAELIHMQNYADSLRVVKANVGQVMSEEQATESETSEENTKESEES
ncbi:hypothetical protein JCM21714_3500 [Gracilibacillus boraciitolerans JCM 21714]|uniref:Flagella basal body P-ring formation protein FlgA SAF domain-containing protein n=1 Tax=Gracilibacillus boraciitolerans JCM 21714 TaxID=1298598 RepID=W4VNK0_9BACI|nr:SAF domain-containing protein [Gracilibacillus boraciitolerans]GAE94349.1 hypothetical protein JCM21714_3500 [Gracilibacillus boraciitolerans JCM 21714]